MRRTLQQLRLHPRRDPNLPRLQHDRAHRQPRGTLRLKRLIKPALRKIRDELGWVPEETFATGIRKTVQWYLQNQDWVADVTNSSYRQWVENQYSAHDAAVARAEA